MPSFRRPRSPAMEEEEDWENCSPPCLDSRNLNKTTVLQTMPSSRRRRSTAMEDEDWEKRSPPGLGSRNAKASKTTGQWNRWTDLDKDFKEPANDQEMIDWGDDDKPLPAFETRVKPCHGGRFVRFNVQIGMAFEVTAKYTSPIGYVGGGAYGIVGHAFDSERRKQVAIKRISNAFVDATHAKLALWEVMLLRHMNHQNIVTLTDIIPPPKKDLFSDVYIAFDLLETDMHKVIHSDKALSEKHCKSYIYQLLCGLKYMHSMNVIHRDLKPSNLLLTKDGVLKICDLGQARVKRRRGMSKRVGTLFCKAPEILLHASAYTAAVDVWSVGCIFVEFILRKPLFKGVNEDHQLSLILQLIGTPHKDADLSFLDTIAQSDVRRHPYPRQSLTEKLPGLCSLGIDLVERMLIFDPRERITVDNAMAHSYFEEFHEASNQSLCPSPSCFDFREEALSIEEIKALIFKEALVFNPGFRSQHGAAASKGGL